MVFVHLDIRAFVALLHVLSRASRAEEGVQLGWKPYSMCSGCVRCLADGNTLPDCESFGSDCSCYHRECPCATCVSRGNTLLQCESYGSDCACYRFTGLGVQSPVASSQQAADPQANSQRAAEGSAACANLDSRMQALHDQCCGKPGQDCSLGTPAACDAGCARELLPFFGDCAESLGASAALFNGVIALCSVPEATLPPLPAGYATAYTISQSQSDSQSFQCGLDTGCGTYRRVVAHCGGSAARCGADPTLCDGAPVYQLLDLRGTRGPVLYRMGSSWAVGDSSVLVNCIARDSVILGSGPPWTGEWIVTAEAGH